MIAATRRCEAIMDLPAFFRSELAEHEAVLKATLAQCEAPFAKLVDAALAAIRGGGKILLFGNGGSAGDAQHLAPELPVRHVKDRAPIPAIALTTRTSAPAPVGHALGFRHPFAPQLRAPRRPGGLALR